MVALLIKLFPSYHPGDSRSNESQKRQTMIGGYLFKYCCVKEAEN